MLLMKDYSADKIKKKADKVDKKYVRSVVSELKKYGFSYCVMNDNVMEAIKEQFPDAEIKKAESFYVVKI